MTGPVWTLSNCLSAVRMLLAVPIALLLLRNDPSQRALIALLIAGAGITDLADGYAARRLGQVTELGKVIDPLADKIAAGIVAAALALLGRIPLWFLGLVLGRDLLILLGGVYVRARTQTTLQSNTAGKWAAATLACYLLVNVLEAGGPATTTLMYCSTLMLLLSFAIYVRRFRAVVRKGIA